MLSNAMIVPTLPAVDINRAKNFYQQTLGLKFVAEDSLHGMIFQSSQNCYLYLYQRSATKADHTVAMFVVDNVESEVNNLKNKGVKFLDYDIPKMNIKTINGITTDSEGMKGAWFNDTEGNIIGISQMSPAVMKAMSGQKVGASMSR